MATDRFEGCTPVHKITTYKPNRENIRHHLQQPHILVDDIHFFVHDYDIRVYKGSEVLLHINTFPTEPTKFSYTICELIDQLRIYFK